MTDCNNTEPINDLAQKQRDASKRFYYKKIRENPEFYAAEKERIKEYKNNRYKNDPEYRERIKQFTKDNYRRKKETLANTAN